MKISTKGRYALTLMIDIALHNGRFEVIALKDVSERQQISKKYLEQIAANLTHMGLLRAVRGSQGGYSLTREPDAYTAGEILRAAEGSLAPVACVDADSSCEKCDECPMLPMWQGLSDTINDYLDSITLDKLMDKAQGANGLYVNCSQ